VRIWNWLMLKISAIGGSPKFRRIVDSPIWAGANDRKLRLSGRQILQFAIADLRLRARSRPAATGTRLST